jgi:ParB family chromosome partitioning protein
VDNSQSSLEGLVRLATVSIKSISANPRQPRQIFEPEALAELAASIKEVGLLQPPVVRALSQGKYELIMVERRLRASKEAGLSEITVIVKETADDDLLRDALLENLHRAQLNPLEEAAAYEQLLKDFGCTQEELATRIGRSRPQISNTLRLLKLPPTVAKRVAAGVLSAGHARALLSLSSSEEIERLATKIVAEGLSVRAVEEIVAMGGLEDEKKTRTKHARPTSPRLAEISSRLSNQLDTRVKIELGRSKGKISIEFASIDDLERILGVIEK